MQIRLVTYCTPANAGVLFSSFLLALKIGIVDFPTRGLFELT